MSAETAPEVVRWEDPAPLGDWQKVAEQLRQRPGEWGLVATNRSEGMAHNIRRASLAAFRPRGAFEASSRRRPEYGDHRADIYARYVGEPDQRPSSLDQTKDFYTSEEVADALRVTADYLRQLLKRPGAPKVARTSDSPTARMRFTADDVKAIEAFLRPADVPAPRRRRRKAS